MNETNMEEEEEKWEKEEDNKKVRMREVWIVGGRVGGGGRTQGK